MWQVCGVVEVAECETKVEEVPGLQCRPAMERVCTQIQQVRILDQTKNICNQTEKYLQTQCTPVTEEQCATLPSVVCEEVPDQVIHDTDL